MKAPSIALRVSSREYGKLVVLGNKVFNNMTGNLNFTTPSPTLLSLSTQIAQVVESLSVWGPKKNHGSQASLIDLRNKSLALHQLLKAMAQYVENIAAIAAGTDYALMSGIIATSGYAQASASTPVGLLQQPENLHILKSLSLARNQVKTRWKRPLNTTSPMDVDSYSVYRGITPDFASSSQVAITTKTEFIDTNTTGAPITWYYWVVGHNAYGTGAPSDVLAVSLFGV